MTNTVLLATADTPAEVKTVFQPGAKAKPGSPNEALTMLAPWRPVTSVVRAMTPVVMSVQLVVPVASKGL